MLVRRFREEYLREHYTELLGLYDQLWNHVYQVWFKADEDDKKVITDFRRDWRQKIWYHQKDDAYTRERGLAELRNSYKERFKKFAEKYFVVEPYGDRGWAFYVRRGQGGVVFPPGSVIELDDGELSIARYSRIRVGKEFGGFILHLKIANDIYASKIKVVSQKGNFHSKAPAMDEILTTARKNSYVDDDDPDFDANEDRLELLLDERFVRCGFAKKSVSTK